MKKTMLVLAGVFLLIVFGCTLPSDLVQKQEQSSPPATSTGDQQDSTENAKLKDKIAELEKQKLEEKIEELEKKVDDKKVGQTIVVQPKTKESIKKPPKGYARVNSPRDGFLALRSEPSADRGIRAEKIPHGKTIRLHSCGKLTVVGGRKGRWCQVVYRDYIGFAFDAYLIR